MTAAIKTYADAKGLWQVGEIPDGADAYIIAKAVQMRRQLQSAGGLVFVARDDARAVAFKTALGFFAPKLKQFDFPAWDCLPYDRISPSRTLAARRAGVLTALAGGAPSEPFVFITTINALTQRVPPRDVMRRAGLSLKVGANVLRERLDEYFAMNGYSRASTVVEPGDYAVRGGLIDVFPPGFTHPIRLDFFGDELESIRTFDPATQRSLDAVNHISLGAVSEVFLREETISRFRKNFIATFGGGLSDDPLYASVSEGIRYQGLEHWLPLFYETSETVFDYLPDGSVWALDTLVNEARSERTDLINDYYSARQAQISGKDSHYRALEPSRLYLSEDDYKSGLQSRDVRAHSHFTIAGQRAMNMGASPAQNFSQERRTEGVNVFEAVTDHVKALSSAGKRVILAAWSDGSSERMGGVFADHDLITGTIDSAADISGLAQGAIKRAVLPIEHGFTIGDTAFLSEQDILGDRLVRRGRRRKGKNVIAEASTLQGGDLVIHIDHGLGRYRGLKSLTVGDAPHDCLEIEYAGGGTLYLPVENIELLSRYGEGGDTAALDRLGGTAWQSRKAKAKKRLKDMAGALIKVAAERALKRADPVDVPAGALAEFEARFPYAETDDQLNAISQVVEDLSSGRPMDRLVCGDVGFGKTEVALRAAFLVAMSGKQVAIIAPTTILSRQHFATFTDRFRGLPIKIRQLSRMVSAKSASETREALTSGQCDIVIGTHALLAKTIKFRDLGLLVIDEEQRFGVGHKERLKSLKANVNVLTLTATPIPRTLQMALSGIRELSIIATPPVDRLAVRTFITPFDTVILREALLRERYRGGQSFFVVPRIADLRRCEDFLRKHAPEISYVIAHGQMTPTALEDVMSAFYDRKYDVLLSTSIIESGIDIPSANTMVVYRADRFGLAQLYQMRGRVGRSKTRAFAYLTTPEQSVMTEGAQKRLKILQSLDTLGAGFSLASHDLDMRGGGNPLGEEQSGHIRDLGVELYQHMLEEAVAELKNDTDFTSKSWSPQVNIGVPVLIPDGYVKDLNVRLSLYRRMSEIASSDEEDEFAAEMIDRFGPMPGEVKNLLAVLAIKRMAKLHHVEKIDIGPKGAVLTFRHADMPDPEFIFRAIDGNTNWRLRPDQTVFVSQILKNPNERIAHAKRILRSFDSNSD